MMLIATIDLASDIGRRLIGAFPECFSETPVQRPVPLSVLIKYARAKAASHVDDTDSLDRHEKYLETYGATVHFNIPVVLRFGCTSEAEIEYDVPPVPSDIAFSSYDYKKTGNIIEHDGMKFVVVEYNNESGVGLLKIAPAECIDVNA